MNDLGEVCQFIRVENHRDRVRKILKIVQAGYVESCRSEFGPVRHDFARNIPLDPGLKFSNTDEPKCDPAETKKKTWGFFSQFTKST